MKPRAILEPAISEPTTWSRTQRPQRSVAWLAILAFPIMLAIWQAFDHSLPMWDAASHIQDSIKYQTLLRHPHVFSSHWIKDFLTVSYSYPMTVHVTNGFLKAIFGVGRFTEALSLVLFATAMSASVYATARILFNNQLAACFSVLFLNCYPLVAMMSHMPMLEFPQLSLCCVAMAALVWWQRTPTLWRACVMGLAMALAATSKQSAAFFLVGPCFYLVVDGLRREQYRKVLQLLLCGAITATALGFWLIPNARELKGYVAYYGGSGPMSRDIEDIFGSNLWQYLHVLPEIMSPLLLWVAALSLIYLAWKDREWLKQLQLPAIGAGVGITLMSLQYCNNPEPRYIMPVLLFPALASGAAVANAVLKTRSKLPLALGLGTLAVMQFLLQNYAPYPIPIPAQAMQTVRTLAGSPPTSTRMEPSRHPTPGGDLWGQVWIVRSVTNGTGNLPVFVNILPSTPELSPHTLNLAAIYEGKRVNCSSFRQFTLKGDIVRYDQNAIDFYQWYVLKTGFQGHAILDKDSETNYNQIAAYVEKSGKYQEADRKRLADGSDLILYKRK